MDQSLRSELCSRFKVIRDILHEISAISVQTRQALEAQLEDSSAFQGVLDAVSSKLCGKVSSLSNREVRCSPHCLLARLVGRQHSQLPLFMILSFQRFFTELEVILGDQVDEKRQQANAFVEELSSNPAPAMIHCVNRLFQVLPSICFMLKEHTMERIEFLQSSLFDQIPFLSDSESHRGEVALPREVPSEAINAAIELCAPEASITESIVEDVTRILSHIASHFSFRNADTSEPVHELHETNVVAAEVRGLLERITMLCRFTNRLKWTTTKLYKKDIAHLQRYITDDLQSKNASVETVMAEMKQLGSATWPATRVPKAPLSEFAMRLPSSHKAHFLSCEQIRALISTFLARERENPSLAWQLAKQEEFVSLLLNTARRYDFPGSWQRSTALASLVLDPAAASGAGCGGDGSLSSWRKLVFSILCTQFVNFPRTRDLEQYAEQAMGLAGSSTDEVLLYREDFLRLPLWFDGAVGGDRAFLAEMKDVMFLLFSTTTGRDSDDNVPSVASVPMLLQWCLYPPCGTDVRSDVGEFLPKYSRGLVRAFRVLARVRPPQQQQAPHQVETQHFHKLLEFVNISNNEETLATEHDDNKDHAQQMHWRADNNDDTTAFLKFCDAYDARLAHQLLFTNPFDALLTTSS